MLIAQAFPGLTVEPQVHTAPDGRLHPCAGCCTTSTSASRTEMIEGKLFWQPERTVNIGRLTATVDDQGVPWHLACKRKSMGLDTD